MTKREITLLVLWFILWSFAVGMQCPPVIAIAS